MFYGRWLTVLVLAWGLSGCTAFVARQIEHPGHSGGPFRSFDSVLVTMGFQRQAMRTRGGVRIAYWIGPPRAYKIKESFHQRVTGKKETTGMSFSVSFGDGPLQPALLPVKGSVVLLHPWSMSGTAMTAWGVHFAASGYEVVMPDLRGQGDSSDAPVGYGPREADDIEQLIQHLRAGGRLPAPLYLFGASYGATVALFAAARVPHVRGVVALEPYANAAAVIRQAPGTGLFGYRWLAHLITTKEVDAAIKRADRKLGLNLAAIDPGDPLAASQRCTLILRGSKDELMSDASLHQLSQRSLLATYARVPDQNHITLPMRTDILFQPLLAWMQALPAAPGPCPTFELSAANADGTLRAASARAPAKPWPH